MRKARKLLHVVLLLGTAFILSSTYSSKASDQQYLFLKNGWQIECDKIWKGGGYIWYKRSVGMVGYPITDVDIRKTFEIQPLFNQLIKESQEGFHQRDLDEVMRITSEVLQLGPNKDLAYGIRGGAYATKGLCGEAIEACEKALQINPRCALAYKNRALAYQRTGDERRAKEDYKTACNLGLEIACGYYKRITGYLPSEIPDIVNQLVDESYASFKQENWGAVIRLASEALELEPTNEIAYTNRAGAYNYMGLYKEAIEDCDTAIKINPHFGLAYNNRGHGFELIERIKQATLDYKTSCDLGTELGCENYKKISEE